MLADKGIRVESDYADKNMNEKIKAFRTYKDPYVLVIGDKEVAEGTVSVTVRGQKQQLHGIPAEAFVAACDKQNKERTLELVNQF